MLVNAKPIITANVTSGNCFAALNAQNANIAIKANVAAMPNRLANFSISPLVCAPPMYGYGLAHG